MTESTWSADGKLWPTIRPPMVPADEDLRLLRRACPAELLEPGATPRILVLGVTSALIDAPWPAGAELHSVDYDPMMIELFWRGGERRHGHCNRWQAMPLPDDYFDLVVGDCSFNALPALADYRDVLREVTRVSRAGAPLISRFFMQSEPHLAPADVLETVSGELAGCGATVARFLLAMACAGDDASLRFGEIPAIVAEQWGDFDDFLDRLGFAAADIKRTRKVLQSDQRLNYPSKAQILHEFEPFYAQAEFAFPTYAAGGHCPTVRFA